MEGFHVIVNPERGSQQNRKSMRFFQFMEFWNLGNWINEIKSEEMRDASCGPVRLLLFRLFLPGIIGESGYNDNNNNNEFPSAFMVRDEGFEKWWLILTRRHTTVVDCLYHIIHWLSMQVRCTEKTRQKSRIKTRSLVAIFQKKKSTQEKKIRRLDHLPSSGVRPVSSHVNKPILRGHPFKRISPLYHLSTRRFRVSIVFFFQPTSSTLILITEIKLHPIPTSQKKKKNSQSL